MMWKRRLLGFGVLWLALLGCGGEGSPLDGPVEVDLSGPPPNRLSEYRVFAWDGDTVTYNDRVVPYDLNTPLFSDYALKDRAIFVPPDTAIDYDAEGVFAFPVGTIIVKTFSYPADFRRPEEARRLIETRVLVRHEDRWEAWPYLWDEDQEDARLAVAGATMSLSFVDAEGVEQTASYLVPQRNQCRSCHERDLDPSTPGPELAPIGPAARHMDRDFDRGTDGIQNQLDHLAALGFLTGMPAERGRPAYDFAPVEAEGLTAIAAEDLDFAARSYLDINCAHCHAPDAPEGVTSQLFLNHDNEDQFRLGVCKRPGSAGEGTGGLTFDLVPGNPDESILVFRTETTEVGAMMPRLGRSLQHARGAEVVRAWVAAMEPMECD